MLTNLLHINDIIDMVKITWLGHAAFKIEASKYTFLIDPWVKDNPKSPLKSYKEIEKADFVLVTHDHQDHGFEDALKICKNTNAAFIGVYELVELARKKSCKSYGGNIGGEIQIDDIKVFFTQAIHSSNIASPCGFIVNLHDVTFYHTGDTAFYSDMEYLSRLYNIDIMMIPICSNYMMGVTEATWAVEKVKPKIVIPCHFNTIPILETNPFEFKERVDKYSEVEILSPGKSKIFEL